MSKTKEHYIHARTLIPGGTQLLSKRPEMFAPGHWPAYYEKAKGCNIWDMDGKKYLDMSYMGIGANVLGYADPDVNNAVKNVIDDGSMSTLNAPEEVELAELILRLHPWADMVRYAKTGGEVAAIAIRIARASTKKDIVLFCGYHGWHDWYLASNLSQSDNLEGHLLSGLQPMGVPAALKGTSYPFEYNNLLQFEQLIQEHKGKIAAVIMEPLRNSYPENNFLEHIRSVTKQQNIVLIFDEISSGFRLCPGGAHLKLDVNPDLAVFGKAISNGFPMSVLIGRAEVMSAAQDSFISSTYWTERVGLAAAIATINKFIANDVHKKLISLGNEMQSIWREVFSSLNFDVSIKGIAPLSTFSFKDEKNLYYKTFLIREMLKSSILTTNSYYASYAHQEKHVAEYKKYFTQAVKCLRENSDNISDQIDSSGLCHAGFQRLT